MPEESMPGSATATVFETYYDRVHRYILSMVNEPAEAEDLTQETFLRAQKHRDSLRAEEALVSWLYRIATNVSLDRLRRRTRTGRQESSAGLDDIDPVEPDGSSVQLAVEQNQMSACVLEYLDDLPDDYRTVVLFRDMHGMSGPEIAAALGLPLSTVKIRLHRARRRLRKSLDTGCDFSHDERNVLVCEPKRASGS